MYLVFSAEIHKFDIVNKIELEGQLFVQKKHECELCENLNIFVSSRFHNYISLYYARESVIAKFTFDVS